MQLFLAILASLVGLFVTSAAVFTVWFVYAKAKTLDLPDQPNTARYLEPARQYFLRWSIFDTAVLLLLLLGFVFLAVDVVAVIRDRDLFPVYHFAYLLCGSIFLLLGTVFILTRLSVLLAAIRPGTVFPPDDGREPGKTDQTE